MRRRDLEQDVLAAAELCVDTGGTKMMGLIRAVKALRRHDLEMPDGALVGSDHPVTSKQAAEWMAKQHPDLCAKVFREIWHAYQYAGLGGLTTDHVQQRMDGNHQSISPRITQLRDEGWIRDSGERRKTRSGRAATVWQPTPAAIQAMNGGPDAMPTLW